MTDNFVGDGRSMLNRPPEFQVFDCLNTAIVIWRVQNGTERTGTALYGIGRFYP